MSGDDIKKECRFYVCLIFGFSLMVMGFFAPPMGSISNSVLVGSGMLLSIGALAIGIDIKGCIHELRGLKMDAYNYASNDSNKKDKSDRKEEIE